MIEFIGNLGAFAPFVWAIIWVIGGWVLFDVMRLIYQEIERKTYFKQWSKKLSLVSGLVFITLLIIYFGFSFGPGKSPGKEVHISNHSLSNTVLKDTSINIVESKTDPDLLEMTNDSIAEIREAEREEKNKVELEKILNSTK